MSRNPLPYVYIGLKISGWRNENIVEKANKVLHPLGLSTDTDLMSDGLVELIKDQTPDDEPEIVMHCHVVDHNTGWTIYVGKEIIGIWSEEDILRPNILALDLRKFQEQLIPDAKVYVFADMV